MQRPPCLALGPRRQRCGRYAACAQGALPFIRSKAYLTAAGGILGVEAYHGGSIRTLLLEYADVTVFPYGVKVSQIIQAISDLRAAASGAKDDQGLLAADGSYIIAPADVNSVAFSRSVSQVCSIVACCRVS